MPPAPAPPVARPFAHRPAAGPAAGERRGIFTRSSRDRTGLTLEELILGAWEGLVRNASAGCPVCSGELRSDRCRDCGASLR